MARREPLNDDERRLLRITARMPLASVAKPGPGAGLGRGESKEDAWAPCAGRLGHLGGAGHDLSADRTAGS